MTTSNFMGGTGVKKKLLAGMAVIFSSSLWVATVASAMPSDADSNTYQMRAEWLKNVALSLGASGDFVSQRDLDQSGEELKSAQWYGANIYFDPLERLHGHLFLGTASGDLKRLRIRLSTGVDSTDKGNGETENAFAWGLSSKWDVSEFAFLPEQPKAKVFVSGGYRHSNQDLESAFSDNGLRPTALDMEVDLGEWQAAAGIAQPLDTVIIPGVTLTPYTGIKFSDVNLDLTGTSSFPAAGGVTASIVTGERNSDKTFGLFVGIQALGSEGRISVDVEGRFIDERAISVNGRIRW